MSQRFRKKQVEVEAVQWTGENREEVEAFLAPVKPSFSGDRLKLFMTFIPKGDWIVGDPDSTSLATIPPETFEATYEPASAPEPQGVVLGEEVRERLHGIADTVLQGGHFRYLDDTVAFLRSLASHQPDCEPPVASAAALAQIAELDDEAEPDSELDFGCLDGNAPHTFEDGSCVQCGEPQFTQPDSNQRYTVEEWKERMFSDEAVRAAKARIEEAESRYASRPHLVHGPMDRESQALEALEAAFNKASDHSEEGGG